MNSQQAWERLRPYCPSIAAFIEDPGISEIEVNPDGSIFVERNGRTARESGNMDEDERESICQQIARVIGKDISAREPMMDARLPDGSRIAAVAPPVSRNWTFTIRKFSQRRFILADLVTLGTITDAQRVALESAIAGRKTILISGATSSGKTTLLNTLAAALPDSDRIVLIEDTAEVRLDCANMVSFEARGAQLGMKAITIRDLVKQSLRFRPDRIIVGEVRGAEAFDLLQALNSGHAGSMSTIHANSAETAVYKLALYCQTGDMDISMRALGASIADAIHVVVQMSLVDGRRVVSQMVTVDSYDRITETYAFGELKGTN